MQRRLYPVLFLVIATVLIFVPAFAETPIKLAEVASVADLVVESKSKLALLEEYLENGETFLEAKKKVSQAAGVLACMAQAISEHPDRDEVQLIAPDLRDAALEISSGKLYGEVKTALKRVKDAFAGKSNGSSDAEHEWNRLIGLHSLMEEMKSRTSKIRRAVRRLENPESDSRHATTLAVLALALHADTHEVKDENDIPQWQNYAQSFQKYMTQLAAAMKKQDKDASKEFFLKAAKVCNECHDTFRDE